MGLDLGYRSNWRPFDVPVMRPLDQALAQRLLALRPAHSRGHQFVTRYPKASDISSPPCLLRLLPAGAVAGWGLHPLESAALSRRTPSADLHDPAAGRGALPESRRSGPMLR